MSRKQHWERVYTTKKEGDVSWFQAVPEVSMQMLESAGLTPQT